MSDPVLRFLAQAVLGGEGGTAPLPEDCRGPRLLKAASAHRVVGLLKRSSCFPLFDAETADLIATAASHESRKALLLASELHRVIGVFGDAGVRVLAYKGPALAVQAFGALDARAAGDLDLLVDPAHFDHAAGLMGRLGYNMIKGGDSSRREAVFHKHAGATRTVVELKRTLSEPLYPLILPFERLWSRRATVPVAGRVVAAIGMTDIPAVLLHHGARHRWCRLGWLADVSAIMGRLRPEELAAATRCIAATGLRRNEAIAWRLTRDLAGVALPWREPEAAGDPEAVRLSAAIAEELHAGESRKPSDPFTEFRRCSRERLRDRWPLLREDLIHRTPLARVLNVVRRVGGGRG